MRLADSQGRTNEIKLLAIAATAARGVIVCHRDAFHLRLHHRVNAEIFAVQAHAPAGFLLGHVPRLSQRSPERLVCFRVKRWIGWAKLPAINRHLLVFLVVGCAGYLLLRQAKFNHHVVHYAISLPEARIVKDVAAEASVDMNCPASKTWPTSSGQV